MVTPARVINPRLGARFKIEIDGIDAALVETVQRPGDKVTVIEHASGGMTHTQKTAGGMETYDDLTLNKIMPAEELDDWAFAWLTQAVDQFTQRVGIPEEYKKTVTVHALNGEGVPIQTYKYAGCFVKEVTPSEHDALDRAAKFMQTVIISVDRRIQ